MRSESWNKRDLHKFLNSGDGDGEFKGGERGNPCFQGLFETL